MKLLFAAPEFFQANPKRLKFDENPNIGLVHILFKGQIVAVAELVQ